MQQPAIQLKFGWAAAFRIAIAIAVVNVLVGIGAWFLFVLFLSSLGASLGG